MGSCVSSDFSVADSQTSSAGMSWIIGNGTEMLYRVWDMLLAQLGEVDRWSNVLIRNENFKRLANVKELIFNKTFRF